jgi:hypothetical protein
VALLTLVLDSLLGYEVRIYTGFQKHRIIYLPGYRPVWVSESGL